MVLTPADGLSHRAGERKESSHETITCDHWRRHDGHGPGAWAADLGRGSASSGGRWRSAHLGRRWRRARGSTRRLRRRRAGVGATPVTGGSAPRPLSAARKGSEAVSALSRPAGSVEGSRLATSPSRAEVSRRRAAVQFSSTAVTTITLGAMAAMGITLGVMAAMGSAAYSGGYYDPWFYGSGYNGYSGIRLGYYGGGYYPGSYYRWFGGRIGSHQGEAAERVGLRGRLLRRAGGRVRRSFPALARGAGTASHRDSGRRLRAALVRDSRSSGPHRELQRRAQTTAVVTLASLKSQVSSLKSEFQISDFRLETFSSSSTNRSEFPPP